MPSLLFPCVLGLQTLWPPPPKSCSHIQGEIFSPPQSLFWKLRCRWPFFHSTLVFYSCLCLMILKLSRLSPKSDWRAKLYLFLEPSPIGHSQQPEWSAQYMLNEGMGLGNASIDCQWLPGRLSLWYKHKKTFSSALLQIHINEIKKLSVDVKNRAPFRRGTERKLAHQLRAWDSESKSSFEFCLYSLLLWFNNQTSQASISYLGKLGVMMPAMVLRRLAEH